MVSTNFTATVLLGCRFHLGQAWWRKIQNLGLANEYKDSANSEIGKLLTAFFGLADTYITQESLFPPHLKTATFDNSSRKDGTDHFHHRFLKIDMDNIRLQVKTIVSTQLNKTRHTVSVDIFRLPR
jgi:hypothetical protein